MTKYSFLQKHKRVLIIKYEDFVSRPDAIQKVIQEKFKFLIFKKKFSEYHFYAKPSEDSIRALKEMRPISSNGIGNWKKNLSRLKHQIDLHGNISDSLEQFGYEENSDWHNSLDNIQIINYETKTGEFFDTNDLELMKRRGYQASLKIIIEKLNINSHNFLLPLKKLFSIN